ncbi:hypothetical protein MMC08_008137 [Hypocenomyce scalaris]|nr:hypothetical protein [Hypocenomyce scalaris]
MHLQSLYLFLTILVPSILALPSTPPLPLQLRSQTCANSPSIIAGTLFTRDLTPPTRLPRTNPSVIWCAPGTQTYISVTTASALPSTPLLHLLGEVSTAIAAQIQAHGDSLITEGVFSFLGPAADGSAACALHVWNANNHQISWGVLLAATRALWDYMYNTGSFGGADFEIFDGGNQVGLGVVGVVG